MGTDVRQLRIDGLGQHEVAALDVPDAQHYWQVGLDLYQDTAHPPCAALFGDITDDLVLPPGATSANPASSVSAAGSGSSTGSAQQGRQQQAQQGQHGQETGQQQRHFGSIAELAAEVDVASCTAVLHCLPRQVVTQLLRKASLLLHPGGLLLGSTMGAPTPREWVAAYQPGCTRWLHSAESLGRELREAGFEGVEVQPTQWRGLDPSLSSMQPLLEAHVGQFSHEGRCLLAFTATKPTGAA